MEIKENRGIKEYEGAEIVGINVLRRTNNFDLFVMNKHNREIRRSTVENFKKDFKVDGYCPLSPIMVKECGEKLLIIKGHHRYVACKESNTAIYFVVNNSLTDEDMLKGEKTQRPFSAADCAKMRAELGEKEYVKLEQLKKETGLNDNVMKILLTGRSSGDKWKRMMMDGDLNITDEEERTLRIRAMNFNTLKNKTNLRIHHYANWLNILFVLDDSELTLKFAKFLHHNPYELIRGKGEFKKIFGKTYKEDLMEKLSKIKL